jgi:hypothetical protein
MQDTDTHMLSCASHCNCRSTPGLGRWILFQGPTPCSMLGLPPRLNLLALPAPPTCSGVARPLQVQSSTRLCIARDLTEHDVVSRIMRKENYLIALLNKVRRWARRRQRRQRCRLGYMFVSLLPLLPRSESPFGGEDR